MSRKDKILNGNALYTFIAIIIGFVAGAVLLAVAGINPGLAYGKLLNGVFGQVKYITWSIVYAAPLILTGLSVAFSFRLRKNRGLDGRHLGQVFFFHGVKSQHVFCSAACFSASARSRSAWESLK